MCIFGYNLGLSLSNKRGGVVNGRESLMERRINKIFNYTGGYY